MPVADATRALPLEALRAAGLITIERGEAWATADLRPYGFPTGHGQWDGWVVSDHTPGLDQDRSPTRPDYVLGVSPASTTLAQLTIDDPVGSALDLGTGCGVQKACTCPPTPATFHRDRRQPALSRPRPADRSAEPD